MPYQLDINTQTHTVDLPDDTPLLWVLRDELNLKGTKYGCGVGECGACTVHIDGKAVRSCQLTVAEADGKITTIEGLAHDGKLSLIQQTWIDLDVAQCGYCQGGQILAAAALLKLHPQPTDAQIDAAMAHNICRCATYNRIRQAIHTVASKTQGATHANA